MTYALTVGQLTHATGVPAKTIRYYEQVGVLPAPRRSATGYRQYTQRDVHRLLFIRRARALGLSLSSIEAFSAELGGEVEAHVVRKSRRKEPCSYSTTRNRS